MKRTNDHTTTLAAGQAMDLALDDTHVYWTDWTNGRVMCTPKSGGASVVIATGQSFAFKSPLVVDRESVFWVAEDPDAGMMTSAVVRASKHAGRAARSARDDAGPLASSTTTIIVAGQPSIGGLVADESDLYFTSFFGSAVRRVSKGGGAVTDIATSQKGPVGIAIDATHIYWTSKDDGTIKSAPKRRANADHEGAAEPPTTIVTIVTNQGSPYAIVVDAERVYWATSGKSGSIASAPRAGGGGVVVLAEDQDGPAYLAGGEGHLYWTTASGVWGVSKGGGPIVCIAGGVAGPGSGAFAPKGVVIDAEHLFFGDIAGDGMLSRCLMLN